MKYRLIILMCLTISCADTNDEFSVYDVDLMKNAYRLNGVKAFIRTLVVNGQSHTIDSTVLDNRGNIRKVFRLTTFSGTDIYEYDSLDRLVSDSHESDTWRDFKIQYELMPEDKKVIQRWIDVTDNDSILAYEYTINYNSTLDTIISKSTPMIGDTILTIAYKYQNSRLVE